MNYYTEQLKKLDKTDQLNVKFFDSETSTNTLTLNKNSIDAVVTFLQELKETL